MTTISTMAAASHLIWLFLPKHFQRGQHRIMRTRWLTLNIFRYKNRKLRPISFHTLYTKINSITSTGTFALSFPFHHHQHHCPPIELRLYAACLMSGDSLTTESAIRERVHSTFVHASSGFRISFRFEMLWNTFNSGGIQHVEPNVCLLIAFSNCVCVHSSHSTITIRCSMHHHSVAIFSLPPLTPYIIIAQIAGPFDLVDFLQL